MMQKQQQSLVVVILMVILSTVTCSQLTLVPYAYLADPLPVYHQSQDTRTGEHAYSYSGGPSAKEEVKGPDGVTRGSYSYVDAHGILQSVFYVADEGGFRVAATNLPTDTDLPIETADIILAKRALFEEQAKAKSSSSSSSDDEKQSTVVTRRKRGTEEDDSNKKEDDLSKKEDDSNKKQDDSSVDGKPYGALASILLPGSIPTATSHQSRLQIHQNIRAEGIETIPNAVTTVEAGAVTAPVLPLLTNPIQLKTIDVIKSPLAVLVPKDYHQNRIQIHRNLGLEGEQRNKDAVKIETVQLQPSPLLSSDPVVILDQPSFYSSYPSSVFTALPIKTISRTHLNGNIQISSLLELPTTFYPAIRLARSSQDDDRIESTTDTQLNNQNNPIQKEPIKL
ncbi:uncharacterized protein LOC122518765 [Polistes fuscatus]|uniref:uncharacterized protein LOC122518765 n=1 Tax=Polistes fuscatus TaxID=30207 RepID=UPI001CA9A7F3|nr:uncharacterized protein LOC122518765 [Polistes fuscatus]XP_043493782.1 uncharacterized protein LOC122518765 [Polistes fuscatus]